MTNDVPLREFMEMRFNGLEGMVDRRLTSVETAIRDGTERTELLDTKREGHGKRIDKLEGFRGIVYKIGAALFTLAMAVAIAGLTGILF